MIICMKIIVYMEWGNLQNMMLFLSSEVTYLLFIFPEFLSKLYLLLIIGSNAIKVLSILVQKVDFETWRFGTAENLKSFRYGSFGVMVKEGNC